MKYHPLANIFPLLTGAEYEAFKKDIAENGLLEPICLHRDGSIIDGRNRYRACIDTGTEPDYWTWEGDDADLLPFILSLNLRRRHMNSGQLAIVALEVEKQLAKLAKAKKKEDGKRYGTNRPKLADLPHSIRQDVIEYWKNRDDKISKRKSNRSERQVYFIRSKNLVKIGISNDPERRLREIKPYVSDAYLYAVVHAPIAVERNLHKTFREYRQNGEWFSWNEKIERVIHDLLGFETNKKTSKNDLGTAKWDKRPAINAVRQAAEMVGTNNSYVSQAKKLAAEAPDLLEEVRTGEMSLPEATKIVKLQNRRNERVENVKQRATEIPTLTQLGKRYPIIYADPPWRYEHSKTNSRKIENQYPTMMLDEIKALAVSEIAAPDAVLFLWATAPKLQEAMDVIIAWGFTYRTCMVWVKDKIGMGYYARGRHELLLIAARGMLPVPQPAARYDSVIEAPRGEHSAKPEQVYERLENMYPEYDKIELFARQCREHWDAWGLETDERL